MTYYTRQAEPAERAHPNRKGVFIGAHINPLLKERLDDITARSFHQNRSLTIAELLTEAIDARDRKAEEG